MAWRVLANGIFDRYNPNRLSGRRGGEPHHHPDDRAADRRGEGGPRLGMALVAGRDQLAGADAQEEAGEGGERQAEVGRRYLDEARKEYPDQRRGGVGHKLAPGPDTPGRPGQAD